MIKWKWRKDKVVEKEACLDFIKRLNYWTIGKDKFFIKNLPVTKEEYIQYICENVEVAND